MSGQLLPLKSARRLRRGHTLRVRFDFHSRLAMLFDSLKLF